MIRWLGMALSIYFHWVRLSPVLQLLSRLTGVQTCRRRSLALSSQFGHREADLHSRRGFGTRRLLRWYSPMFQIERRPPALILVAAKQSVWLELGSEAVGQSEAREPA